MFYYVDGYNFLFSMLDSRGDLAAQRQTAIRFLQKQFTTYRLSGVMVFDGAHRREEESGRGYQSPLEIVYASKGQSADAYIVEKLEATKNPAQVTVITNDKGLTRHARYAGAKVETNETFLQRLRKKKKKVVEKKEVRETSQQMQRLLKIFETKVEEEED